MTRQADREASNALVQNTSFYAGALARAHGEIEQHEKTIALFVADKKAQDEELRKAHEESGEHAADAGKFRAEAIAFERALKDEMQKCRSLNGEVAELRGKIAKMTDDHVIVQRALVESHHERDGLRQKLRDSGEAIGWVKGNANAFLRSLQQIVTTAGYVYESPDDLLDAVRDLIKRAGKTPSEYVKKGAGKLPPKSEG